MKVNKLAVTIFWSCALIGLSPAALSGSLLPFSWVGGLGTVGLDLESTPVSLSLVCLLVLVVGLLAALITKQRAKALLLAPLLILSAAPVTHLSFDTTMLSITDELIANEGALTRAKSIGYSKTLDRWLIEPLMKSFKPIANILDDSALAEKQSAKAEVDELVSKADAAVKAVYGRLREYQLDGGQYWNSGDNAWEPNPPTYPQGRPAFNKYWAERLKAAAKLAEIKKVQTRLQNEVDALSGIQQKAESDSALNSAEQIVRNWFYTALYTAFSFLVLCVYLWGHRLASIPMAVSSGFVVVGSLLNNSFFHSLYPILVWLLTAAALYVLLLAVKENRPVVKQLRDSERETGKSTNKLLLKTTLLWSPALALLVGAYILSTTWQRWVENYVYSGMDKVGQTIDPKATNDAVFEYRATYPEESLESHVHRLNSASINKVQFSMLERAANLQTDVAAAGGDAQDATMKAVYDSENPIVPKTLPDINPTFKREKVRFSTDLIKYIKKLLKERLKTGMRSAYDAARIRSRNALNDELTELKKDGNASAADVANAVNNNMMGLAYDTKMENRRSIIVWFNFLSITFLINVFILIFAAVNSFVTIFARIIFHPKHGGITFSLANVAQSRLELDGLAKERSTAAKNLSNEDNEYIVNVNNGEPCVVVEDSGEPPVSLDGTTGHFNFPQPTKVPFRRILSGRYNLLKVSREPGLITKLRHRGVHEFSEFTLANKSGITFDIKSLLLLRGNVKLDSVLTMHAASKIMLRNYLTIAHGEGSVLLKVNGKSPADPAAKRTDLVSPFDVVGFDLGCQFDAYWDESIWSLYFHGAKIRSDNPAATVLQAGGGGGNSVGGVIRTLRYALLPI